jgi:hypothetical protein
MRAFIEAAELQTGVAKPWSRDMSSIIRNDIFEKSSSYLAATLLINTNGDAFQAACLAPEDDGIAIWNAVAALGDVGSTYGHMQIAHLSSTITSSDMTNADPLSYFVRVQEAWNALRSMGKSMDECVVVSSMMQAVLKQKEYAPLKAVFITNPPKTVMELRQGVLAYWADNVRGQSSAEGKVPKAEAMAVTTKEPPKPIRCYRCGNKGHFQSECKNRPRQCALCNKDGLFFGVFAQRSAGTVAQHNIHQATAAPHQ